MTAEDLERILIQKEGESTRDTAVQARSPGGVGGSGKRAIGKAVAKGGLLLKGKNPQNVRIHCPDVFNSGPFAEHMPDLIRCNGRRTISERECRLHQMHTARMPAISKLYGKSTSTSSFLGYYVYVMLAQCDFGDIELIAPIRLCNNVRMIST
jgi:hypothetical protein